MGFGVNTETEEIVFFEQYSDGEKKIKVLRASGMTKSEANVYLKKVRWIQSEHDIGKYLKDVFDERTRVGINEYSSLVNGAILKKAKREYIREYIVLVREAQEKLKKDTSFVDILLKVVNNSPIPEPDLAAELKDRPDAMIITSLLKVYPGISIEDGIYYFMKARA